MPISIARFDRSHSEKGDTIVEVLMAIAVAAFAIGTSYAIANRSLQHAISARERNEATNILQSQVSDLKLRYEADQTAFKSVTDPTKGFVVDPADNTVGTKFHFCLSDSAAGQKDPLWGRQPLLTNNFSSDDQADTLTVGNPGYSSNCVINSGGTDYYADVSAMVTTDSQAATANKTVYRFIIRWTEISSGTLNKAIVYYRL